jgi:hypothetical protein
MTDQVHSGARYKGFDILPRPKLLANGKWNTDLQIMRGESVLPIYPGMVSESKENATAYCLEFGRKAIDGEIPSIGPGELP